MRSHQSRTWSIISLAAFVGVWYFLTDRHIVNSLFLPHPTAFLKAVGELIRSSSFWKDIGYSCGRVFVAFLLSIAFSIPVGSLIARFPKFGSIVNPYIEFIRYTPVPALIPLTILLFGVDESAKIALLFIGTAFQMVVLVVDDLQSVPIEYRELMASLGIKGFRREVWLYREILPRLYNQSRVMIGWCWTYVVIAELVAAEYGIGHFIKEAQRLTNTPSMYVGIVTMGVLGIATDFAFRFGYPRFFPYAQLKGAERD